MSGLAYSPDSAWLAWAHPGPEPLSRIRLARLADDETADDETVDVTDGRFVDSEPVFTADGKYLAFLSARIFDPVYDAHFFDLSFPFGSRPYLVPLAADTPSPFAPLPQGRPVGNGPDKNGADRTVRTRTGPRARPAAMRRPTGRRQITTASMMTGPGAKTTGHHPCRWTWTAWPPGWSASR